MAVLQVYLANITKAERDADGDLIVTGKATGPDLDSDSQICDPEWLKTAMPAWMKWGNLREMHQPIAAGIGLELEADGDSWNLRSQVVDANTIKKIEAKVLKGYSIGIKSPRVVKDAAAKGGRIVGGEIVEISYVDRPANPTASITIAKMVDGEFVSVEADIEKSTFTSEQIDAWFTPEQIESLKAGSSAEKVASMRSRLAAGVLTKAEDDTFLHDPKQLAAIRTGLAQVMQAELDELINGENEMNDIYNLMSSLQYFLSWWTSEAYEDETTHPSATTSDGSAKTEDKSMDYMALGISADIAKAATAVDAPEEAKAELVVALRKAIVGDTLIDQAQIAAVVQSVETLTERLAQIEKMAAPGAPAKARTAIEASSTVQVDNLIFKAMQYETDASITLDRDLAKGYLALAKSLRAEATNINKLT